MAYKGAATPSVNTIHGSTKARGKEEQHAVCMSGCKHAFTTCSGHAASPTPRLQKPKSKQPPLTSKWHIQKKVIKQHMLTQRCSHIYGQSENAFKSHIGGAKRPPGPADDR